MKHGIVSTCLGIAALIGAVLAELAAFLRWERKG